jgi:hypothetical protein
LPTVFTAIPSSTTEPGTMVLASNVALPRTATGITPLPSSLMQFGVRRA